MTSSSLRAFAALSTLALLGAGCFGSTPVPANNEPTPAPVNNAPAPVPTPTPEPTPTPSPSTSSTYQIPPIDNTWQTYTNKSLGFSFQYPTKGRYAPEWEVKIYTDNGPVKDGCFMENVDAESKAEVTVEGRKFCRTLSIDAAAGSRYYTYHYATEVDSAWVVVNFTKRAANGDNYADERCHGHLVFPMDTCPIFDPSILQQQTDLIISTFRENA